MKTRVMVEIITNSGCSVAEGDYGLGIVGIFGGINTNTDIELIKKCVEDNIESMDLPEEGSTVFILEETAERVGLFRHRWFEIIDKEVIQ